MLLAFAKVVHDECGRSALRYLKLYGTDIDERCVLMCKIQLRMNGLDSFGRIAGMCAALSDGNTDEHISKLPALTPSAASADIPETVNAEELSNAVILHQEEWQKRENIEEQLALF